MSDRFDVNVPATPITPIDLSNDESIRHTGHTVAVFTPSGVIFDLWFYDNDTVSVDVRIRDRLSDINGDRSCLVPTVLGLNRDTPASQRMTDVRCVAVVAR